MGLIAKLKRTKLAAHLKNTLFYEVYKKDRIRRDRRDRAIRLSGKESLAHGGG